MTFIPASSVRGSAATVAFVVVVFVGAVSVDSVCFPAYSHGVPARWECDLALFAPCVAALVAGLVVGWKASPGTTSRAFLSVLLGLGIAVSLGYLRHWYGSDILHAGLLALFGCILPAILMGAISSRLSASRAVMCFSFLAHLIAFGVRWPLRWALTSWKSGK